MWGKKHLITAVLLNITLKKGKKKYKAEDH